MGSNHYQMSERATAQIEIDYLRDTIAELKKQLNDADKAREVLKRHGYFVENLWHTRDVTDDYQCTDNEAQEFLRIALTNEATMEQIRLAIDYACDALDIKPIQNV